MASQILLDRKRKSQCNHASGSIEFAISMSEPESSDSLSQDMEAEVYIRKIRRDIKMMGIDKDLQSGKNRIPYRTC